MSTAIRQLQTATSDQAPGGPFRSFGQQLQAIARYAIGPRGCDPDHRLLQVRAAAGGSEALPSGGGFLVQSEFVQTLANKIYSQGEFLSRCAHYPIMSDNFGNGIKIPGFDEQSRADGSRFGE
jgi:hypothetical protein